MTLSSQSGGFALSGQRWIPVTAGRDVSSGVTGAYQGAPCTLQVSRLREICTLFVLCWPSSGPD